MKIIEEVLTKIYANPDIRRKNIPLFMGHPGIGKTSIIQQFANKIGVTLLTYITANRSHFELTGMAYPNESRDKMIYLNFDMLTNLKDGDILFLDEITHADPYVLKACLTLLDQRELISGTKLANIMIVAAGNYEGMTHFSAPIKQRFLWYDVKFEFNSWHQRMNSKYGIPVTISKKLAKLIKEETFTGYNHYSPRSIDLAIERLIHDIPSEYDECILPILSEIVKNESSEVVLLSNGEMLEPNEACTWISLKKHQIKLNKTN